MTNLKRLNMPEEEMPREKLLKYGADKLSTAELIAILLQTGTKSLNVLELANKLLNENGGLQGLCRLTASELKAEHGIKNAKASTLAAVLELGRRIGRLQNGERRESWQDRLKFQADRMAHLDREEIYTLFLDKSENVLAEETLSYGGISGAFLDLSLLYRRAVRVGAKSVVMMHNHPNGILMASAEDNELTECVRNGLKTLEIKLKGHFVTACGKIISIS